MLDYDEPASGAAAAGGQARPNFTRTNNKDQAGPSQGDGLRDIGRILGTPISRNTNGEVLSKAVAQFKIHLDPAANGKGSGAVDLTRLQILPVDPQEYPVQIGGVVFAYPREVSGETVLYHYTCLLEGSLETQLGTRTLDNPGRGRIVLPALAGDFMTDTYQAAVQDAVTKSFKSDTKQIRLVDCGWRTVDEDVDFSEEKNPLARNVAFYSIAAIQAMVVLEARPDEYFHVGMLAKGESIEVNMDVSGAPLYTADGQPKRADMVIELVGKFTDPNDRNHTQQIPLTKLVASVNAVYAPEEPAQAFGRPAASTQKLFQAQLTINTLDTGGNQITPELIGMAMASASVAEDRHRWLLPLLPSDTNPRDIGATGFLTDARSHVDVVASTPNDTQAFDYIQSIFSDSLTYALEIETGGDNSWVTNLFLSAAQGNVDAQVAVIRYFDRLTNNKFSELLNLHPDVTQLFSDAGGVVYLAGRYADGGENRPLSDYDTLRWLQETGHVDPEKALLWQEHQLDNNRQNDESTRIGEMAEMLSTTLGSSVKFKRTVRLIYIHPKLPHLLSAAIHANNVTINAAGARFEFGGRRLQGNNVVRRFASTGVQASNLFSNTQRNPVGGGRMNNHGMGGLASNYLS